MEGPTEVSSGAPALIRPDEITREPISNCLTRTSGMITGGSKYPTSDTVHRPQRPHDYSCDQPSSPCKTLKARQCAKIRELGQALVAAGFRSLDSQAAVLGLPRSTAWSIFKSNHKGSGLSASVINRMLSAPHLPLPVRAKIFEYIDEKTAGLYGDSKKPLSQFLARLSVRRHHRRPRSGHRRSGR